MIVATDLDRTLLPNGHEPYDGTLPIFFDVVKKHDITLIYVTGRSPALFEEARADYNIELPDYLIGSVGTTIHERDDDALVPLAAWEKHLAKALPSWNIGLLMRTIEAEGIEGLRMQEEVAQNAYKLSFYLEDAATRRAAVTKTLERVVAQAGMPAQVVVSVDPLKGDLGLIDILPTIATKMTALEFVREYIGVAKEEVVYAGDSGNDLLPLTAGYRAILVKNAHPDTAAQARRIAEEKEESDCLYLAEGKYGHNGNYASGILEGLVHYGVVEEREIQ